MIQLSMAKHSEGVPWSNRDECLKALRCSTVGTPCEMVFCRFVPTSEYLGYSSGVCNNTSSECHWGTWNRNGVTQIFGSNTCSMDLSINPSRKFTEILGVKTVQDEDNTLRPFTRKRFSGEKLIAGIAEATASRNGSTTRRRLYNAIRHTLGSRHHRVSIADVCLFIAFQSTSRQVKHRAVNRNRKRRVHGPSYGASRARTLRVGYGTGHPYPTVYGSTGSSLRQNALTGPGRTGLKHTRSNPYRERVYPEIPVPYPFTGTGLRVAALALKHRLEGFRGIEVVRRFSIFEMVVGEELEWYALAGGRAPRASASRGTFMRLKNDATKEPGSPFY
ncbi:hypothetical protein DFH08DRAFT_808458 [Mycena albidolilacea]|uniref:Uncharacterized protein n=1 Tax=Mycena albidolilacea TaxID=1033008 RepID=A0AAD7A1S3_9AGAR|nr:hypothetical protein DFH08DRAFT_808458 [Mycena albidolilacea]